MKILLAGDSTMASYGEEFAPLSGWGQALAQLLPVEVQNFAKAGSSTRSFMEEGRFTRLLEVAEAGDVALIQFGHNDQNPQNGVSLNEYTMRLQEMVTLLKEKVVIPILCTPVEHRVDSIGQVAETFAPYKAVLRRLQKEHDLALFDLNRYTYFYYQSLGAEKAKELFLWLGVGEHPNYPAGSMDDTHFSAKGAQVVAEYVKKRLRPYLTEELFTKTYYGACMYPEVWPEEVFASDVETMAKLGMNFARIGEFAWKDFEPQEGVYDFSLLERSLDLYQAQGIDVCMCIPTPTPPRWFTKKYPESLVKNQDGTVMVHGSRQHVCTNNPDFHRHAYRLTQKLVAFLNRYDNVVLLQLDNEFKCHVDLCYCDTCQKRWPQYLATQYQTVEWLNQSWGTSVWSEAYDSFEDVVLPWRTPFLHNSSLMNAFRRFTADTLNEFAHDLCHFIRMETAIPITHNSAFGFNLQNDDLFGDLDVAGFDTYAPPTDFPAYTLNLDRWRNVKDTSQEVFLLETCTANAGHLENYATPRPKGFVTSELFIGLAGNLKSFNFWLFRGHRYGVEQPHSAVLTAWGEPDRGYEDVVKAGELHQRMAPLLAASKYVKAKVAVLYSDYAKRFYTIDNGGYYDYRGLFTDLYGSLIRKGVSVEVIQESSSLAEYQVLFVPFLRWVSPQVLRKLQAFVQKGGKLILGPMTGDRTEELTWPEHNGLDSLGEWLGLSQIQQFSVKGIEFLGAYGTHQEQLDRLVTTFVGDDSWETLGQTSDSKATFIGKTQRGKGSILYIGALPENLQTSPMWDAFCCQEVLPFESDREFLQIGKGLMKYRRKTKDGVQIYITNFAMEEVSYQLHIPAKDLLTNRDLVCGTQHLAPYECQILEWTSLGEQNT